MRRSELKTLILCAMGALLFLQSCVNDDYDLNEDIDMTIGVGGNLTLPQSDTEPLKMKDVLDLDDDDVVKVRPNDPDSVYYLIKKAEEPGKFEIDLPDMVVEDPTLDPFRLSYTMPDKKTLLSKAGLTDMQIELVLQNPDYLGQFVDLNVIYETNPINLNPEFHLMNQSFEMPEEVVALSHIGFAKPMKPDFLLSTTMSMGQVGLHDVYAEFPGEMQHDNVVSGGSWLGHLNEAGHHVYNLPKDVWLDKNSRELLSMEFIGIDFTSKPWTRENNPDGYLHLKEDVHMYGTVTVKATAKQFLDLAGKTFYLDAEIKLKAPDLDDVTVMVDPKIDSESTTVELDDLPDFLTENDVTIILQSPAILFDVTNNTPVEVNCWGKLTSDKGYEVNINRPNGTDLQIGGNRNSNWCIYDGEQPEWGSSYSYYRAEGLCDILRVVPNQLDLNFDARVNQEYYTLKLGRSYSASVDYRMECPLAFGAGSQIVYSDTIDEWHEDMADYEVQALKVTATLINDTPLDELDLEVSAIDLNKQVIEGITVTPLKNIKNGDKIEILLTSEAGAMKNLDGIILKATARVTNENSAPLKANSTIQLTGVGLSIVGGVIADLN